MPPETQAPQAEGEFNHVRRSAPCWPRRDSGRRRGREPPGPPCPRCSGLPRPFRGWSSRGSSCSGLGACVSLALLLRGSQADPLIQQVEVQAALPQRASLTTLLDHLAPLSSDFRSTQGSIARPGLA